MIDSLCASSEIVVGSLGESGIILLPSKKCSVKLLQLPSFNDRRRLSSSFWFYHVQLLTRVAQDIQYGDIRVGGQQHLRLFQIGSINRTSSMPCATQATRKAQRASDIGIEHPECIIYPTAYSFSFVGEMVVIGRFVEPELMSV